MGIFGQNSPFDAEIEKATSEKNTNEPWNVIMDICDKITTHPKHLKDCLKSILKRVAHSDPHVVLQAITLLDACVKNCGKQFHLEVASREFETEFKRLLLKAQPPVALKMRQLIKKWAENEFKIDSQLNLIPAFYEKLKSEGHDFSDHSQKQPKQSAAQVAALKDPNVVTSQQEEEDIAKAIELSLKEAKSSPKKQPVLTSTSNSGAASNNSNTYPSLYPTFSGSSGGSIGSAASASSVSSQPEPRKVRALYDFEAAEENELTFVAGEIIHVLDDSDPNWWKGYNHRGEGLFPSNFVTADLSVEPERLDINQQQKSKKTVQFEDESSNSVSTKDDKNDILSSELENLKIEPEINEEKVDRLTHLLHEANPEDPSQDTDEMLRLEDEVNQMGPLIDAELERVDRKHAKLTQLSSDLVDAINLYHTLMREPPMGSPAHMNYFSGVPSGLYNPAQPNIYAGGPQQLPMSYGMPNMYHTNVTSGVGPQSLPPQFSMMQMPSGGLPSHSMAPPASQHQLHQMQGNPLPINNFTQQPTQQQTQPNQVVPMQYQNGQHSNHIQQSQQPQNLTQQQPQILKQMQSSQPQSLPQQTFIPQQQSQQQQGGIIHQQFSGGSIPPNHYPPQQVQPQNQQLGLHDGSAPPQLGQYHLTNSTSQVPHPSALQHTNGIGLPVGPMSPNMVNITSGSVPHHLQQQQQINSLPTLMHNNMPHLAQHLPHPHPQQFAAINQPVTQTILGQHEPKANIPIYQQQR